jgi:hypothetical protein
MIPHQLVTRGYGVKEGCVPGAGATPPSGLSRRLPPRWSLPPPVLTLTQARTKPVRSRCLIQSRSGT